jgi:hypothetical protein
MADTIHPYGIAASLGSLNDENVSPSIDSSCFLRNYFLTEGNEGNKGSYALSFQFWKLGK